MGLRPLVHRGFQMRVSLGTSPRGWSEEIGGGMVRSRGAKNVTSVTFGTAWNPEKLYYIKIYRDKSTETA